MPKLDAITEQNKLDICKALEEGLPLLLACDLVGVKRRTCHDHLDKKSPRFDASFCSRVAIAKAVAVRGLVALTKEQNGAWRLLKNVGREFFKEHVEVKSTNTNIDLDDAMTKEQKRKSLEYALKDLDESDSES